MFVIPENKDHKEIRVIGKELMYDDIWMGNLEYDEYSSPRISFNPYVSGDLKVEVLDALRDSKFIELAKTHDVHELNGLIYIKNLLNTPKNQRSVLGQLIPNLESLKIALDYAEDDNGLITYAFMSFIDKLELKMMRSMVNFTDYELEEIKTILNRIQSTKSGKLSFFRGLERCITLISKELDCRKKTLWYKIKQWFLGWESMFSKLRNKIKTFIDHFKKPTYYSHSALLVRCAVLKAILDGKFSVYKYDDTIHVGLGYANIRFFNDKWEVPHTVVQNASKLLPGMISIAYKKMQNADKIYIPTSKGLDEVSIKNFSVKVEIFRMLKLYHTDKSYAEYALKRFKDYVGQIEAKGIIK